MANVVLYEFVPTRSLKCRWALLEADIEYESAGNGPEAFGSEDLCKIQPLGKLPAAVIDGKPLFESSAITTAVADLEIRYGGKGVLGSSLKPSFLYRLLRFVF